MNAIDQYLEELGLTKAEIEALAKKKRRAATKAQQLDDSITKIWQQIKHDIETLTHDEWSQSKPAMQPGCVGRSYRLDSVLDILSQRPSERIWITVYYEVKVGVRQFQINGNAPKHNKIIRNKVLANPPELNRYMIVLSFFTDDRTTPSFRITNSQGCILS